MKLISGFLSIALLLLTGCGYSKRDVVGVYHLLVEGQTPQAIALELKNDGTYVQTLRISEQGAPVVRNGRWTMGKWPGPQWLKPHSSPGYFSVDQPYAGAEFVFLLNGLALEKCPKCQTVPYDVIPLHISAGMMNTALAQDPKGSVAYDK